MLFSVLNFRCQVTLFALQKQTEGDDAKCFHKGSAEGTSPGD